MESDDMQRQISQQSDLLDFDPLQIDKQLLKSNSFKKERPGEKTDEEAELDN